MPIKVSRPGCEETNSCYLPSIITINQGQQVTWSNEDVAFHTVTSGLYDEPSDLFDSGHLDPEEKFIVSFDEPGTFDYFCTLHPWMAGKVIVE
jgi:plastocyanin